MKDGGGVSALEEEVKDRCDLYQTVFGHSGDPKVLADLMNNPRNELTHRMSGNPLALNLEEEAVNLIQRAIDNFQRLRPGPNAMLQRFNRRRHNKSLDVRANSAYSVSEVRHNKRAPADVSPPLNAGVRHRNVRHLADWMCGV